MLDRRNLLRAGGALAATAAVAGTGTSAYADGGGGRAATAPDWAALRSRIQGDVVLPGEATYDASKQLAIGEYDAIRPAGVVYGETADDVSAVVRFARDNGLTLRTRSGGHNFAGWSTGDGIVLDVRRIKHIKGGGRPTVHLGPGVHSIEALAALKPYNQQFVTGTCPDVAVGGYLSGGGVGYQSRAFGIGSDRVVSAQVVLADGRQVRASETCNPDLFWALRGSGGGNFGVVVDFEVRPVSAPRMVFYEQFWNWDDADAFLAAWQEWYVTTPRRSNAQVIVIQPDAGSGNPPLILQQGAYYGTKEQADAGLAELNSRVGATPASSKVLDLTFAEGMEHVYGIADGAPHPPRTQWQRMRARMISKPLGTSGTAAALAAFEATPTAGQTRYLSFMGLGGAVADLSPRANAFVHRDALFHVGFGVALGSAAPAAEDSSAAVAWATNGFNTIDPLSTGHSYINFPDTYLKDWQHAYYGENYARLVSVKKAYDPTRFFNHPRAIGN
ncbi:FAD-binding oxidoreductase [Streptomyces chryseus]|uniref:FAD-binding dehydrogenase n=1 Tax=Streptomyces chryseus TaxID=68186 RepID=A0ABQ3DUR8_9ACTN|nr:FAD-binding oxidoreductase [Streptomyces chryseus]GHB17051.1 FAD-binding dehydrogenase [Streptomyces chryseus]